MFYPVDLDKVADIALEGVEYRPYEEVEDFLKAQSEGGKTVLADSNQVQSPELSFENPSCICFVDEIYFSR